MILDKQRFLIMIYEFLEHENQFLENRWPDLDTIFLNRKAAGTRLAHYKTEMKHMAKHLKNAIIALRELREEGQKGGINLERSDDFAKLIGIESSHGEKNDHRVNLHTWLKKVEEKGER
ncbi:MAG: hypothetical protein KJ709_07025 [Nanoarchaeota archaeon]|nr:hypothetical protein [Nanoarchaeota archaeon]